jgi:hypothetical protein
MHQWVQRCIWQCKEAFREVERYLASSSAEKHPVVERDIQWCTEPFSGVEWQPAEQLPIPASTELNHRVLTAAPPISSAKAVMNDENSK